MAGYLTLNMGMAALFTFLMVLWTLTSVPMAKSMGSILGDCCHMREQSYPNMASMMMPL